MLSAAVVALCLGLAVAVPTGEIDYNVTVLEGGVLVKEQVQVLPGLQIYHVPKHHNREHVKVYLDFENNHVMTVFMDKNKCQLSKMEVDRPDFNEQAKGFEMLKNFIAFSGNTEEKELAKIENPQPMQDLSFVRREMREACEGKHVHWAVTVDVTNEKGEYFLVPGEPEQQHRVRRDDEFFQCPILNFNQKCKRARTTNSGGACYYFVTCAMANTNKACMSHVLHGSIECRPCCTLPNSPTTGLLLHCDHLTW